VDFAGGFGPELDANNQVVIDPNAGLHLLENISSIERYRRTLLFQQDGLSASQIRSNSDYRRHNDSPLWIVAARNQADWNERL
jgi:hypothetical protein